MSIINRNNWDQFPRGPKAYEFFEDFFTDESLSTTAASSGLLATVINTGTVAMLDSVHGGVARVSGAASTDNSGANIQGDTEFVALRSNTETKFLARIRFGNSGSTGDTVTQSDFYAGLILQDTDITGGVSDGIYFKKADGAATIECVLERDSVEVTSGAIKTLAESTWYELSICVEMAAGGAGTVKFFIDGNLVSTQTSLTLPYDSEEYLTPSMEFMSGDTSGTRYVDVDYIGVAGER